MPYIKKYYLIFCIACACLFIAIAPSFYFDAWSLYNQKRIFQGVVLFLGLGIFYGVFIIYRIAIPKLYVWLIGILGIFLALSIVNAAQSKWAFLDIGWYILLVQVAFVFAFLHGKNTVLFKKVLFSTVFIMALIYSIRVTASLLITWFDPLWPVWPDVQKFKLVINGVPIVKKGFLGFSNYRFLNHIQTWSLPILISAYFYFKSKMVKTTRIFVLFMISFWWSLVFATGARGTLLSLGVSVFIILLLFDKESMKWTKVLIGTCIMGVFIYLSTFEVFFVPDIKSIVRFEDSGRLELWVSALNLFMTHPVLGVGPMHFSNIQFGLPLASPHNMFLIFLSEWGLISFLLFIGLTGSLLIKWLQLGFKNYDIEKITVTGALIAGVTHSMVSGILITPISQIIFCIIIGWAISVFHISSKKALFKKRENFKFKNFLLVVFLILVSIMTFKIFIETGNQINKSKDLYFLRTNEYRLSPRFWDQGFIGSDIEKN